MEDRTTPYVHWVGYNIPTGVITLPESVLAQPQLEDGTMQGLNATEEIGYLGPYPPQGQRHEYTLTLYALDTMLDLQPGARRDEVIAAMEGHILATSELRGSYLGVEL
jgi:Raf kinase inhibitor-like YbhB/YbcL family protein